MFLFKMYVAAMLKPNPQAFILNNAYSAKNPVYIH